MKRARSGDPGAAASAARNQGCWSETWLGTMSSSTCRPEAVGLGDQRLGFGERPEHRLDRPVVGHVVAGVLHRRRVPGVDPDRVDAQLGDVGQARAQPGDVADPVAVAVGEAADVDLVDDRAAPPRGCDRRPQSCWRAQSLYSRRPDQYCLAHQRSARHNARPRASSSIP